MTECQKYECQYFEMFGSCVCFIECEKCKKETHHIDKECMECGEKIK